ncbi:MAG: cytochrome b/b6 domain-containing protein [Cocleimonas sp.]
MKKYHPFLVTLHWLLVPLLMLSLVMGGTVLDHIPNDSPEKVGALKGHMIMGFVIVGLMLLRFVTRLFTKKPPHADIGNSLLNNLGIMAHYVLYLLVFAMAGSGIAMSIQAGLPDIVFGGSGAVVPESLESLTPRIAHGIISKVLFLTIILHVLAALYHQFIRKDGLLGRMWFGRR